MPDVIGHGHRLARRVYRCGACCGDIAAGERHYWQSCVAEGRVYTWHEHPECREIAEALDPHHRREEYPEGWLLDEVAAGDGCPSGVSAEAAARWLGLVIDSRAREDDAD